MTKSYESRKMMLARLFWSGCWSLPLLGSFTACVAEDSGRAPTAPLVTPGASAPGGSDEPGRRKPEGGTGFERRGHVYHATTLTHDVAIIEGSIRLRAARSPSLGIMHRNTSIEQASSTIDLETVAVRRGDTALDVTVLNSELPEAGAVAMVRAEFVG